MGLANILTSLLPHQDQFTSLVEANENYRLVTAGSLALLRQILKLELEN